MAIFKSNVLLARYILAVAFEDALRLLRILHHPLKELLLPVDPYLMLASFLKRLERKLRHLVQSSLC